MVPPLAWENHSNTADKISSFIYGDLSAEFNSELDDYIISRQGVKPLSDPVNFKLQDLSDSERLYNEVGLDRMIDEALLVSNKVVATTH